MSGFFICPYNSTFRQLYARSAELLVPQHMSSTLTRIIRIFWMIFWGGSLVKLYGYMQLVHFYQFRLLKTEMSSKMRRQAISTLGILGALDPYTHKVSLWAVCCFFLFIRLGRRHYFGKFHLPLHFWWFMSKRSHMPLNIGVHWQSTVSYLNQHSFIAPYGQRCCRSSSGYVSLSWLGNESMFSILEFGLHSLLKSVPCLYSIFQILFSGTIMKSALWKNSILL